MRQADVIVWVVDSSGAMTAADARSGRDAAPLDRAQAGHPGGEQVREPAAPTRRDGRVLGASDSGDPILVSALHGEGTGDLLDSIVEWVPREPETGVERRPWRWPSSGHPNVGKSSLANWLIGERRSIVRDEAGTTRDAIDTTIVRDGQNDPAHRYGGDSSARADRAGRREVQRLTRGAGDRARRRGGPADRCDRGCARAGHAYRGVRRGGGARADRGRQQVGPGREDAARAAGVHGRVAARVEVRRLGAGRVPLGQDGPARGKADRPGALLSSPSGPNAFRRRY